MKISVLFGDYRPFHENKDPGQIPLGLIDNGVEVDVITITKPELENYTPRFGVIQKSKEDLTTDSFWSIVDSDVVIVYYLWLKYPSTLIKKIKLSGKKIILKLDNDGRIAYPLQRHIHRVPLSERLSMVNLMSEVFWRISPKSLKQKKHRDYAEEFIKEVELSNAVVIESPDALTNLNYFLAEWGRSDLIKKTHLIPNPVTPDFLQGEVAKKENVAVTHGRWDDYAVKNTGVMVETVIEFLRQRKDYRFVIFGSGIDLVKKLFATTPPDVIDRVSIRGFMEHENVLGVLENSRMFFVPSRWESFSIAAAEAVCRGCSIVGTPVEALRYLSMEGFSGTIAATFHKKAILAALIQDALKWDKGYYDSKKIADFWRPKLDRKTVAKSIANLVT